jgi:hypothetical protein
MGTKTHGKRPTRAIGMKMAPSRATLLFCHRREMEYETRESLSRP